MDKYYVGCNEGDWNIELSRAYGVSINFGENLKIIGIQWGVNLLIY